MTQYICIPSYHSSCCSNNLSHEWITQGMISWKEYTFLVNTCQKWRNLRFFITVLFSVFHHFSSHTKRPLHFLTVITQCMRLQLQASHISKRQLLTSSKIPIQGVKRQGYPQEREDGQIIKKRSKKTEKNAEKLMFLMRFKPLTTQSNAWSQDHSALLHVKYFNIFIISKLY